MPSTTQRYSAAASQPAGTVEKSLTSGRRARDRHRMILDDEEAGPVLILIRPG
jgi:hypothetical protein